MKRRRVPGVDVRMPQKHFDDVAPALVAGRMQRVPWLWRRAAQTLSGALLRAEDDFTKGARRPQHFIDCLGGGCRPPARATGLLTRRLNVRASASTARKHQRVLSVKVRRWPTLGEPRPGAFFSEHPL